MASYLPTPKSKLPKPEKKPAPPKVSEPPLPPAEKPIRRRKGLPDWAKGMLLTVALAVVVFGGLSSYAFMRQLIGMGKIGGNIFNPSADEPTALSPGVTPTAKIPELSYKPWNGANRVTILAMGLDARDWGPESNSTAARSDTMIVLSMDPIAKTAAMLSIPRDLYVDIPGYGFDKINKAYFYAEKDRLPIGGPGLAIQTVENLLGIPIDYYAVVDFNSFTTVIDKIGGIDVYIPFDNMIIDPIGSEPVEQLHFGWNHLKGSEALAFARARSTEGGDFDRAVRTQQVILAVRDKVLNLNMLPTLIFQAKDIYNEISSGIKTNLTFEQIIQLGLVVKDIQRENYHQGVIDESCLLSIENFGEESYLIPDPAKVRDLRNKLFTSGGPLGYATPPADLAALALKENAKIEIVNASGKDGAAGATRDFLVRNGFSADNINIRSATTDEIFANPGYTLVTDYTGRPYTVRLLYDLMGLRPINLKVSVRVDSPIDIQVFLKADWTVPK
jgi:LCP family protein required for cell wall assembly